LICEINLLSNFGLNFHKIFPIQVSDTEAAVGIIVADNWGIFGKKEGEKRILRFVVGDESLNFQSDNILLNTHGIMLLYQLSKIDTLGLLDGELTFIQKFSEKMQTTNIKFGRFATDISPYYFNGYLSNVLISDNHQIYSGPFKLRRARV
jgi:hypothetical protein